MKYLSLADGLFLFHFVSFLEILMQQERLALVYWAEGARLGGSWSPAENMKNRTLHQIERCEQKLEIQVIILKTRQEEEHKAELKNSSKKG